MRRLQAAESRLRAFDWPWQRTYLSAIRKSDLASARPDAVVTFNDFQSGPALRSVFRGATQVTWLQNEQRSRRPVAPPQAGPDLVLACSDHVRAWTEREHPALSGGVVTVPSGVDLETFHPRAGWPSVAEQPRLLFIGRLDPNKGPDVVLEAAARLEEAGRRVSATIVGGTWFYESAGPPDPYVERLKALAAKASAQMTGHVGRERVPSLIREHDIAVLPSRAAEPFGLVVLEAMASGLAVVASDRGGMPEAAGGAALLVDPDDLDAVVATLDRLLSDHAELESWRRRALERAHRQPWDVTVALLKKAVADKRNPGVVVGVGGADRA